MPSILDAQNAARATPSPNARTVRSIPSPLWVLAAIIAALLSGAMPTVHLHAMGGERLQDAGVRYVRALRDEPLTSGQEASVRATVRDQSPALAGGISFTASLVAVVLGGCVLSVAATLAGADLSTGHTLAAAAAGHAAGVFIKVLCWVLALSVHGADGAAAVDWLHVAPASLGNAFGTAPGRGFANLMYASDVTLMIATVVVALLLSEWDAELSPARSVACAAAFPIIVISWRLLVSSAFGVPLG